MTKKIKVVYETVEIEYGTPIKDIPALVLGWLNKFGNEAKTDNHIEVEITYERLETPREYSVRMGEEARRKDWELRQLKELIAKHGVPEDAR